MLIFFLTGIVGDWKQHFTEEQSKTFDDLFRQKMEGSGLDIEFEIWVKWHSLWHHLEQYHNILIILTLSWTWFWLGDKVFTYNLWPFFIGKYESY